VLSMVCTVCFLWGVLYVVYVVWCLSSFGGVKCYLWGVLCVVYWGCSVCHLLGV
jgi:hypothetical protein